MIIYGTISMIVHRLVSFLRLSPLRGMVGEGGGVIGVGGGNPVIVYVIRQVSLRYRQFCISS